MKNIKSKKINFFQKIFIKIARLFGFEIINQDSGFIPSSNKYLNDKSVKKVIIIKNKIINIVF